MFTLQVISKLESQSVNRWNKSFRSHSNFCPLKTIFCNKKFLVKLSEILFVLTKLFYLWQGLVIFCKLQTYLILLYDFPCNFQHHKITVFVLIKTKTTFLETMRRNLRTKNLSNIFSKQFILMIQSFLNVWWRLRVLDKKWIRGRP